MRRGFGKALLAILVFGVALFSSCNRDGSSVRLSVRGSDVPDSSLVYIVDVEPGPDGFVRLDSARTLDGAFSFEGKGYEDGVYYLMLPPGRFALVYVGTPAAQLTLAVPDSDAASVSEGGLYSATLTRYNALMKRFSTGRGALEQEARSLQQTASSDATQVADAQARMAELEAQYDKLVEENDAEVQKLIAENPSDMVALFILRSQLERSSTDQEREALRGLYEGMDKSLASSRDMKWIAEYFEKSDRLQIGKPFVDFEVEDAEGGKHKLSDVAGKGQVVLVEFWASWCGYCRQFNPELVKLYGEFHAKGFEIFGVSLDKDRGEWQEAVKADGLGWTQYVESASIEPMPSSLYQVRGIPYNVLLDKSGVIIGKGLNPNELRLLLTDMLP